MLSLAITLIVTLLIVGLLLWAVESMPFINADVKKIIRILVIVITVLWCIQVLFGGNWSGLHFGRLP